MNQHPEVRDDLSKPPVPPDLQQQGVSDTTETPTKQTPEDVDKSDNVKCGRSDGVGGGVVAGAHVHVQPPPLVTPPPAPVPVRHVLPQIPTMSHSRLAVSKASRKVQHIILLCHTSWVFFPSAADC